MLSWCTLLIMLLNCPADSGTTEGAIVFFSYAGNDRQFSVAVDESELLESPSWDSRAENPPLSARRAIDLAELVRRKTVGNTQQSTWKVVSAAIVPDNAEDVRRWFWLITFRAFSRDGGALGGPQHELQLVVLMNGRTPQPKPVNLDRVRLGPGG